MKTLRHLGGILLGAVGLLFFFSSLGQILAPTEMSRWNALLFFVTLGCLPILCAAALLKRSVMSVHYRCCPECGSADRAPAGMMLKRGNWWVYQFGGWIIASLWGASRENQVRCVRCDTLYFTETRGTRIAGIILWIVVLFFVIAEVLDSVQPQ